MTWPWKRPRCMTDIATQQKSRNHHSVNFENRLLRDVESASVRKNTRGTSRQRPRYSSAFAMAWPS